MKNVGKGLMFIVFCSQLITLSAQQIITATKIKVDSKYPSDSLREVNALLFLPNGFEKVVHPIHYKYDENNKWIDVYNPKEDVDSAINRSFNIAYTRLKKDNIFIGTVEASNNLSSFFDYSNDDSSKTMHEAIENWRARSNNNFTNYKIQWQVSADSLLQILPPNIYKSLNADTAFLLYSKASYKYQSNIPNYKAVVLYLVKYDLGFVAVEYFYPVGEDKKVYKVINDTWGVVQFIPDNKFKSFINENVMPKQIEPNLYLGKFSFVNNPDQLKRAIEKYKLKKMRIKSQQIASASAPLVKEKKYEDAKVKLKEALKIDSLNGDIYNQLAFVSLFQNQKDSAWYFWNKYKAVDPHSYNLWITKGILYESCNQTDSAVIVYKILLERDSLDLNVYRKLLNIYSKQQDTEKLKTTYERVNQKMDFEEKKKEQKQSYRILNNNVVALIKIDYAKYLLGQRESDAAIAVLQPVIDNVPKQATIKPSTQNAFFNVSYDSKILAECYFTYGLAYGMEHDNDNAKKYLLKAQELGKEIPDELKSVIEE